MHLIKTPLSVERGAVTTFHVNREALDASEIPLMQFLAEHQNPNSRFPEFPFQIEDTGYGALLLWPEALYAAFRITRLPITLDAICAWLQDRDIETSEGIKYTIIPTDENSRARAGQTVDSEPERNDEDDTDQAEFQKKLDAFERIYFGDYVSIPKQNWIAFKSEFPAIAAAVESTEPYKAIPKEV